LADRHLIAARAEDAKGGRIAAYVPIAHAVIGAAFEGGSREDAAAAIGPGVIAAAKLEIEPAARRAKKPAFIIAARRLRLGNCRQGRREYDGDEAAPGELSKCYLSSSY
jgi:hypothetical protein